MVYGERIKPKSCKLLHTAMNEFRNSSQFLPFDNLLLTNNKSIKFSAKNHGDLIDGNSKPLILKKPNTDFIFLSEILHTTDTKTKLKWTRQLISKLNLMHSKLSSQHKIIDLDCLKINAENNLVIDLTSSKKSSSFNKLYYMSPKHYFNSKLSDKERDIWTIGICIYYINTSNFPWERASVNDKDFRMWVKEGKFKDKISETLLTLLKDMLNVNQTVSIKLLVNKVFEIKANKKVMR